MPHQTISLSLVNDFNQVVKSSSPNYSISIEDAIAGYVTDCPDGLLNDSWVAGFKEFDEKRDASLIDDTLALDGISRGDVGEGPGSLELKLRVLLLFDVLYHAGDESCVDYCLDGGRLCDGEYFSDSDHAVVLFDDVGTIDGGDEFAEDIHGVGISEEAG